MSRRKIRISFRRGTRTPPYGSHAGGQSRPPLQCGTSAERDEKQSAASHAEMEALAQANEVLHSWRLDDCDLYVTLEPCPMCAGAILNARIRRVFYGARDDVMGACGGVLNLYMEGFPRPPQLVGNICGDECRDVLQSFFRTIR